LYFFIPIIQNQQQQQQQQMQEEEEEEEEEEEQQTQEQSESEEEEVPLEERSHMNFDTSLPSTHSYLGNVNTLGGRTFLDTTKAITLPLYVPTNFVLFPGQTLPLRMLNRNDIKMISAVIEGDRFPSKTFGVVNLVDERRALRIPNFHLVNPEIINLKEILARVGTTAEIQFAGLDEGPANILAKGRQRFRVLNAWFEPDGLPVARVQILEDKPSSFPNNHNLCNIIFMRSGPKDKKGTVSMGWCPRFVYDMLDEVRLAEKARSMLLKSERNSSPRDPTDLSFWIANSHRFTDSASRQLLLELGPTPYRLRKEIEILNECLPKEIEIMNESLSSAQLYCICSSLIANDEDIFCMSSEGPLSAYVNPHGFLHEAITLYRAKNMRLRGSPSTENTWFPGYAWTIAECASCSQHLGWKFTATSSRLIPSFFWAVTRSSLTTRKTKSREDDI